MSLRKLFLLTMVAALCLGRPAFSQENKVVVAGGTTAQIFNGETPSVQVTGTDGKILASIPIEKYPGKFIYSKSTNTLYVVHNAKKGEHFISAVNLTTNRVDKQIKVGSGAGVELYLSKGERRLFCYTAGKNYLHIMGIKLEIVDPNIRNVESPFEPTINVIDTASNEVIATYNLIDSFRAGVEIKRDNWRFASNFLVGTDDGILIVHVKAYLGEGIWLKTNPGTIKQQIAIFKGQSPNPANTIDTTGTIVHAKLSETGKHLFAAFGGDNNTDGLLFDVNIEKGTYDKHAITLCGWTPSWMAELMAGHLFPAFFSQNDKFLFAVYAEPNAIKAPTIGGALRGVIVPSETIAYNKQKGPTPEEFVIFNIEKGSSAATAISGKILPWLNGSMLSKDATRVFVAFEGEKNTSGSLLVVNLEDGTFVVHTLTRNPKRLVRLGSKQELWIMDSDEMSSLSETGELGERRIPLNKTRIQGDKSNNGTSDFQDGILGETISLGDDRVAIMISNKHKVALIDLKKLQIDAILPTMTAGDKAKIIAGRVANYMLDVGLEGTIGGVGLAHGINLQFPTPTLDFSFRNELLLARPDGRFLYALNLNVSKVTVIDVQAATVVKRISVNEYVTKIQVSPDGKHLICTGTVSEEYAYANHLNFFGPVTQQINLEANELEK